MNKKMLNIFLVFVFVLLTPISVMAKDANISPPRQDVAGTAVVSFADLGYADSNMSGPFDSTRKVFSTPPNWSLLPGGYVDINYDVIFSGTDVAILETGGDIYAGLLIVSFNSQIIGQIRLSTTGSHTQRFEIPAEALQSIRENGQHELDIRLNAQFDCLYDVRTFVTIRSTSFFDLPYEVTTPELNLAQLPAPFYLSNSLLPDRTALVIPDTPSALELKAALNVMSGFGSMVGTAFDFHLYPLEEMTNDVLASSNLIFVGTVDDFPLLQGVNFPNPSSNGGFAGLPADAEDDGVVQLALSPWNNNKVVLLVSGITDEAVVKAAAAVSSGRIFVYQNPTVVYVSDVQDLINALPFVEDFTLADLGYENATLQGVGVEQEEYLFYVSKEQVSTRDGMITLVYYHSGLLDYGLSSLNVYLNNEIISSQPFTEETEQITYLPIKIPPGLLKYGENRLVMSAGLEPNLSCDLSGLSDPWVTVSNQTSLHIPAGEAAEESQTGLLDLKFYPTMFLKQSDLGDLAFVLPENDSASWKVAADLAYNLGEDANPVIPDIEAVFASEVPENVRTDYSLIVVGKAADLPFLSEINEALPAPFDFSTNEASERDLQIVYRLPSGVYVGYLELLASPYNPEAVILVASGNTEEGIALSGSALVNEQFKDRLAGQFVVTNGVQVAVGSGQSHFSVVGTLVPSSGQVITTPLPNGQQPAAPGFERPVWLVPVLITSAVVVLLISLFVLIRSFREDRSPQMDNSEQIPEPTEDKE